MKARKQNLGPAFQARPSPVARSSEHIDEYKANIPERVRKRSLRALNLSASIAALRLKAELAGLLRRQNEDVTPIRSEEIDAGLRGFIEPKGEGGNPRQRLRVVGDNARFRGVLKRQRRRRLTVEELASDCLDVRELQRAGIFRDDWVTLRPLLRWPDIERMRVARYLIQLELRNQVVPQQIRVSWTHCHFGGYAALAALFLLQPTDRTIVQGNGRVFLPSLHRKSNLCKSGQEHSRSAPFRGLQAATAPWWRLHRSLHHFRNGREECIGRHMRGCGAEPRH